MGRVLVSPVGLLVCLAACVASVSAELTAYEQLAAHGLPSNLLPMTVLNYTLYPSGAFVVQLDGECYSTVHEGDRSIPVYYASTLTGVLSDAKLSYLKGISVKPPPYKFFWLQVVLIYVDKQPDASIHIGVGLGLQEALPLETFSRDNPVCEDRYNALEGALNWISRLWQSFQKATVLGVSLLSL